MSVKCEICGKEFKNSQGLRGHKTFVHQMTTTHDPPARLATEQELSEVNEVVEQLVTLLKQILDLLSKQWGIVETQVGYSRGIAEQVNKLVLQVSNAQTENQKLAHDISKSCYDLGQVKISLKRLSRFIQYEFAGVDDDVIWELCLDKPELKIREIRPKLK